MLLLLLTCVLLLLPLLLLLLLCQTLDNIDWTFVARQMGTRTSRQVRSSTSTRVQHTCAARVAKTQHGYQRKVACVVRRPTPAGKVTLQGG
jgi:hypothetical protein